MNAQVQKQKMLPGSDSKFLTIAVKLLLPLQRSKARLHPSLLYLITSSSRFRRRKRSCSKMTSSSSSTDAHVELRSSFSASSSSSLHALLLSSLNLLLLVLASASFAPLFLLRTSPTSFGWALFAVSSFTALSALLSLLSSHLARPCFAAHLLLVLAASVGQALGFLTLLLRPGPSLSLLGSARGAREQQALARLEAALLLGMFLMQSLALVAACTLRQRWQRQFEEMEADREEAAGRRRRRMARVQEEAIANAAAAARKLEEKLRNKKGQWAKNDLSGRQEDLSH